MFQQKKPEIQLLVAAALNKASAEVERAQQQFIEEQRGHARHILQIIEKHLSEQGTLKAELVLLRARIAHLESRAGCDAIKDSPRRFVAPGEGAQS